MQPGPECPQPLKPPVENRRTHRAGKTRSRPSDEGEKRKESMERKGGNETKKKEKGKKKGGNHPGKKRERKPKKRPHLIGHEY